MNKRIPNLFLTILVLLSCSSITIYAGSFRGETERHPFEYIDLMDHFWQFQSSTKDQSIEDRILEFRKEIWEPNRHFFAGLASTLSDARITDYLLQSDSNIEAIREFYDESFEEQFNRCFNEFLKKVPDMTGVTKTYLLPSMGFFKGRAIPVGDEIVLLLAIDELAKLKGVAFDSTIYHELFHVYNYQILPTAEKTARRFFLEGVPPELYKLLWFEGLASYTTRVVDPRISNEDILNFEELRRRTEPILPELIRILKQDLKTNDITGFFGGTRKGHPQVSGGCGYYLGLLVVEQVADGYPLQGLVRLEGESLFRQVDSALQDILDRYE